MATGLPSESTVWMRRKFGQDIQHQQVREMIRRDRNHPSIIMWSMGNETDHSADGAWAMAEDSSRIIHYRHVNGNFPDMQHTHDQMEMENLLRCTIRGWYNADVRDEEPVNGQHAGHEELQHDLALIDGKSQRGRIDVNGLMWIYHDHGCDREYLNAPLKHVNPKGWVDSYRVPKMMYYLWQAHWLQRPMVYIHAFDWTERYLGQTRCVKINSNCDKVELKLDGLSLGVMEPTKENGFTVVFPGITVTKGTLVAEGRRGDEVVVNELAMASVPEQIVLSTKQREIVADRTGISLVHVDIVDEKGVHVFGATNELKVTVTGPGKLVGPSVYTTDIDKADEMEGTMYIDTPFAIPVRSTTEPGTIIIEVSSSGLETGIIQIKSLSTSWKENGMIIEQPVPDAIGTYPCDPADLSSRPEIKFREVAPYQIMEIENDIDFTEIPADKLKHIVDRFIIDNNPGFQSYPEGFPYLIQQMMDHFQNERIMVADDYNFNIQCYNRFCRAVHRLRNSSLSKSEKSIKRQELADLYVRDRHEQEEMMF